MKYIGLDPGAVSGAWAIIDHNRELVACGDIPNLDGRVISMGLYDQLLSKLDGDDVSVAVEQVGAMPKQGISSTAKFMRAAGSIETVGQFLGGEFKLVTPQAWKKHHGLIGSVKKDSLVLARKLFPSAALTRAKDHGRADALLIALWLLETTE